MVLGHEIEVNEEMQIWGRFMNLEKRKIMTRNVGLKIRLLELCGEI